LAVDNGLGPYSGRTFTATDGYDVLTGMGFPKLTEIVNINTYAVNYTLSKQSQAGHYLLASGTNHSAGETTFYNSLQAGKTFISNHYPGAIFTVVSKAVTGTGNQNITVTHSGVAIATVITTNEPIVTNVNNVTINPNFAPSSVPAPAPQPTPTPAPAPASTSTPVPTPPAPVPTPPPPAPAPPAHVIQTANVSATVVAGLTTPKVVFHFN
jgi:hypothetical protein